MSLPVSEQRACQNCQRRFTFLLSDTSKKELINDNFLYDKLPPRSFPQHSGQVNLRGLMHACITCHRPWRKLSSQWTLNCVERKMYSEWLYLMHHGCLKVSLPSILVMTLPSFYFCLWEHVMFWSHLQLQTRITEEAIKYNRVYWKFP